MKICELVDCVFVDVGNAADMIWIVFLNNDRTVTNEPIMMIGSKVMIDF